MSSSMLTLALWLAGLASARTTESTLLNEWLLDRWTTEDGLPLNHVVDLAVTPDGFLWLATFDGLVRFDGSRFQILRRRDHPELPSNRFIQVHVDAIGNLWIITETGHLARFDGERFQVWEPGPGEAHYHRLVESGGGLWALGVDTLSRLGPEGPEELKLSVPGERAATMASVGDEQWLGTSHGLYRLRADGTPQRLEGVELHGVRAIQPDQSGAVWLGAQEGVFLYQDGQAVPLLRQDGSPLSGICDIVHSKSTWIWTRDSWVSARDGVLGEPQATGPAFCEPQRAVTDGQLWRPWSTGLYLEDREVLHTRYNVQSVLTTPEGDVWVATNGDGLLRLHRRLIEPRAPGDVFVTVLAEPGGGLWVGRLGGEVTHHTDEGVRLAPPWSEQGRMQPSMPALLRDALGRIWLSWRQGVCIVQPDSRCQEVGLRWDDALGMVRVLLQARDGRIWVGGDGVVRLLVGSPRGSGWQWTPVPLPPSLSPKVEVGALAEDADGSMWIGTRGAGVLRQGADGTLQQWAQAQGMSSDIVRALWISPEGNTWVGTEDAGLCRIASVSGAVACLGVAEGLFDDTIHSITADAQGRLWMSTNRGLFWVLRAALEDFAEGRAQHVVAVGLTEREGMRHREANGGVTPAAAMDEAGRLWFPTQDGLAMVDPARVEIPSPPPVLLERIRVSGATAVLPTAGETLSLSSTQRNIEAEWTAVEFERPEQLRFRHRLVGFEGDWSTPSTRRSAAWTNLPPGDYTLEVQASRGGAWSVPTRLPLRRQPAFVETTGFLVLLGLVGLGLGGLGSGLYVWRQRAWRLHLRALVEQRTAELAAANDALTHSNAQLGVQAQHLAEQDALRTRLIADLSHELRTPLTLVAGPLSDLLDSGTIPPGPSQESLAVALRNTRRLEILIEQFLDVARLEGGRLTLRVRRRDLCAFLHQLAARFRPLCERQQLTLQLSLPAEPVLLYFDLDLMDKIVGNLLSNAVKFTPAGGLILIRVEAGRTEDEVRVAVQDTGIGIAPALQARVFERFFQGDQGDQRRFEGVGIGLSLARELAELHGGQLTCESDIGQGSTFWLALPLGVDHLSAEDIDTEGQAEGLGAASGIVAPPPEVTGLPRVLVVEDHPDMRAFLVAHLERHFVVEAVASGAEALAHVQVALPAAIVSDVMMPGMDGLELCRRLRAEPALATIPVLLASAKASEDDRLSGLSLADDYLTKPLRMRELVLRVKKLIARRAPASSALASLPPPAPAPVVPAEPPPAPEPEPPPLSAADQAFQARLEALIEAHLADSSWGIDPMARAMACSRRQLLRDAQRICGQPPSELLRTRRMERGQQLLQSGAVQTVGEAADQVGLSAAYFSRLYSAWFGHPPSDDLRSASR